LNFASQARRPTVEIDALLLALAHEHGAVDFVGSWAELDRLAALHRVGCANGAELTERAEALVALFRREGFQVARAVAPEDAFLDAVLRRRTGHPLVIASICAAVAGRSGLRAAPIRCGEETLVGLTDGSRAVAVDPVGERSAPPCESRWLCAHEVAFLVLEELAGLLAMHGRFDEAMRAARLRLELPISGPVRERVAFEVEALRARLN
jgi:regulator of sirC expression with transglutaminase-like and TPR domain